MRQRTVRLGPTRAAKTPVRKRSAARILRKALARLSVASAAVAFVTLGGADVVLRSAADAVFQTLAPTQAEAAAQPTSLATAAPTLIWTIDHDGDGVADFSNPTHGGVRGVDAFGSGVFGAVRDAGKRRHQGVDYVAAAGAAVRAPITGRVSRLGYAYRGNTALRFVEIVNPDTKFSARVLYVAPSVAIGDDIVAGEEIGVTQDISARYPGITNHVHVELRDANRRLIDATDQLPAARILHAHAQTTTARPSEL